jgi:hypothetical protein
MLDIPTTRGSNRSISCYSPYHIEIDTLRTVWFYTHKAGYPWPDTVCLALRQYQPFSFISIYRGQCSKLQWAAAMMTYVFTTGEGEEALENFGDGFGLYHGEENLSFTMAGVGRSVGGRFIFCILPKLLARIPWIPTLTTFRQGLCMCRLVFVVCVLHNDRNRGSRVAYPSLRLLLLVLNCMHPCTIHT